MNHHQSKMNFAVKKKARGFSSMGPGFVDQMETIKMEERLQLMKKTMELEREERKNRGGQFWKSGQKGKLTTYANTVLQAKLSNKKIGKVKMLTEEQLNLPNRNETTSLSRKLSDISNNSSSNFKPSTKNNVRLCGQCESNGAALCCIQCTEVYCTACFSAYHKKGALRKHRSISLEVSSTPRSKPPSQDKRLFDLALYTTGADTPSQSDSPSPSGAICVSKKDEEEVEKEATVPSLMDGNYNETESAASFQAALQAWRTGDQPSATSGAISVSPIGAATFVVNAKEIPSSQPKPKKNEVIDSSTSTMKTASLASLMHQNQTHTLSYAERLLVKKNRRTPISWEVDPLAATEPSETKENSEQMKTRETSSVLDSAKMPERLSVDEPVTFSSLYSLVAPDTKESDRFSPYEEEILPGKILADTYENVQNELPQTPKDSKPQTEDFTQHSSISIVPLAECFREKRPSSSASQSDEKMTIESTSSHQSGKKSPTIQVQTPRKQKHKSRRPSSVFQATNLTTAPSEGLQMVCQLAKSQHRHNDGQQPSILMAGVDSEAIADTDEVSPSGRESPFKSDTGLSSRPATSVKISYTLYKMSPRSWHPVESISQVLSDSQQFLRRSYSLSDKSGPGGKDTQSKPNYQRASTFDSPQNTIRISSSTFDKSAMMEDPNGDRKASGNLTARLSGSPDPGRSSATPGCTRSDTPQTMMEPDHILTYCNNNAISQHAEECDAISPNSITEEAMSPILVRSPTPVYFCRSKTMSPITTIHATRNDRPGTPIFSPRSTPRNKSTPPDLLRKRQKGSFDKPGRSIKHSPRSKTISPVPSEINSEENVSPALSFKASATSLYSAEHTQGDNSETPIPTIIDDLENLSDTPVHSVRNTPRSKTMPSIPMIKESQLEHSLTPTRSIKSTPRSKTMSTIDTLQETQKERCDSPVYSMKGTPRYESMSPISTVQKIEESQLEHSVTPTRSIKGTPRSKTMSPITTIHATHKDRPGSPIYSARSTPRNKSTPPDLLRKRQKGSFDKPGHPIKHSPRSKTISPVPSEINSEENVSPALSLKASATSLYSAEDTQGDNIETPIPTIIDDLENPSDTPVLPVRNTPRSNTMPSMIKERQLGRSVTPTSSIKSTPRSKTMSTIYTPQKTQKERCDSPVYSVKGSPRYESMSPISTVEKMIEERKLVNSVTPTRSIKSTPRSKTMSTIDTLQETQKARCDSPVYSVKGTPRYESISPIHTALKSSDTPSLPESKSASQISNIPESICGTPVDSLRRSPSCKTALSIDTMIEFQENDSATSLYSLKGTLRSKTVSPIPTIIETQEGIPDTPVPSVKSTPTSPFPTIIENELNFPVSPDPSGRDTPGNNVTFTSTPTKSYLMSNRKDINEEETLEYNAKVYQMLVNKELKCHTPDPTDHVVPLLPTATDQNKNNVDLEEPSETTSATETELTSSEGIPITSENTTPHSSSPSCNSNESGTTPANSEEKLPIPDKLATPFYMCNSEMYDDADSQVQGLDSAPIHANAKLKKSSASTKKYIIRRQPEITDGTKLQKSNSPRYDDLQPESSSSSTLSVLELKRNHFKQSNNGQNVVSLDEEPNCEQNNLVPDWSRSISSESENVDCSVEAEDDPESVFSSLTKMSVDSLEEEPSESLMFNGNEFMMSDDLQAEIDEMEQQIAEEIKVKALK